MKIESPSTKVYHKKSGLPYRLVPRQDIGADMFYLTSNDGMVPSGQMVCMNEQELDDLFVLEKPKK